MIRMTKFNEMLEKHMEKLELYVPVVAKVHGGTHPEFHKVRKVYDEIIDRLKTEGDNLDFHNEFSQLREITDNYTVPGDVCETYEAVYVMLEEIDKAYNN